MGRGSRLKNSEKYRIKQKTKEKPHIDLRCAFSKEVIYYRERGRNKSLKEIYRDFIELIVLCLCTVNPNIYSSN